MGVERGEGSEVEVEEAWRTIGDGLGAGVAFGFIDSSASDLCAGAGSRSTAIGAVAGGFETGDTGPAEDMGVAGAKMVGLAEKGSEV